MKLQSSIRIDGTDSWMAKYNGLFYKIDNTVCFFFAEGNAILSLKQGAAVADTLYCLDFEEKLPLPNNWILIEEEKLPLLFIGDEMAVDVLHKCICCEPPKASIEAYHRAKKPSGYYEFAPFQFEEYCISHRGQWGYVCTKNNEKLWKFSGYAYLYTDIMRWNDRIYFGTAGQGGYFYALDIESGAVVAKIKTGGTAHIVRKDQYCYILSTTSKCRLLCVDLCDGTVAQEVELPGRSSEHSCLRLIDDQLHAITFEFHEKHGTLRNAVWNCISL